MMIFSRDFWSLAFERMIKTIAQTAVAVITASTFIPSIGDAWVNVATTSALAGMVSVLTSLASYDAVQKAITAPVEEDVKLAVTVSGRQGPLISDK